MTNVPGPGFLVVLAAVATLLSLQVLAAASLAAARLSNLSLPRSLAAVHAAGALVGALVVLVWSPSSFPSHPAAFAASAVGFCVLAVVGGLLAAAVAEGFPVAVGALVARALFGAPWSAGVRYGTVGYVVGGVGGVVLAAAATGSVGYATLGTLLAVPGAVLAGPVLGVALPRVGTRLAVR